MQNKKFDKPNPDTKLFDSHSFSDGEMYKHIKQTYINNPQDYLNFLKRIILNRTVEADTVTVEGNYYIVTDEWGTEYKINNHGFRSKCFEEIKHKPVIVGIGCSITHGTGLDPEEIWIHKLAEQMNCEYVNLSMPSCSTSITSMYCSEYILKQFTNVQAVFVYIPPPNRVDLLAYTDLDEAQYGIDLQHVTTHSLLSVIDRDYTAKPLTVEDSVILRGIEHTAFLNYTKDELLLQYACKDHNIPYLSIDSELFYRAQWSQWPAYETNLARDGSHDGELLHTDIANTFSKLYTDK